MSTTSSVSLNNTLRYRHLRRNFALFLLDYFAFGLAISLMGTSTAVIPSFVARLTDSKFLIGFTGSLYLICWSFPQMFLAQIVNRGTRRLPFIRPVVIVRLPILVAAGLLAIFGEGQPTLSLLIFLTAYAAFAAGDSLIALPWGDLLGTGVPHEMRGVMFGIGQFSVALGAFAMSALARWALSDSGLSFPQNYAVLFGMAGALFMIGGIGLAMLKEEDHGEPIEPGPTRAEYARYVLGILRHDPIFRRFVVMRFLFDLSFMAAPFYGVYAMSTLGLSAAQVVSESIILLQVGSATAAILMAVLSRRSGSRAVLVLCGVLVGCETGLAVLSGLGGGQIAIYGAFVMAGAFHAILVPTYYDYVITLAPTARRPIYLGLTNTLGAFGYFGALLGGVILQTTSRHVLPSGLNLPLLGTLAGETQRLTPYPIVFVLAFGLGMAALFAATRLPEPRHQEQRTVPVFKSRQASKAESA